MRQNTRSRKWQITIFQSTHRVSDATTTVLKQVLEIMISIHAPRERCDENGLDTENTPIPISIHAPREQCDVRDMPTAFATAISIHAPRERCDLLS